MHVTKLAVEAALLVGLSAAAVGVSVDIAEADPSGRHVWCPGQSMCSPSGPGVDKTWLPRLVRGQIWPQRHGAVP